MTLDKMIAVLQAAKDGKTIQWKHRIGLDPWSDWTGNSPTVWNFQVYDYRIKPRAPREWRINRYEIASSACNIHNSLSGAIRGSLGPGPEPVERIHVREVLD